MREVERKYDVPAGFTVSDCQPPDGAVLGDPVEHHLTATYYDTPDLRLARERVSLRRRTGGSDDGWHIKRFVAADERDEMQLPPSRSSTVPAAVSAEVRALTRGGRLAPVLRLSTVRTEWPLLDPDGRVLAHVTDDSVSAQQLGEQAATLQQWREVEVELADGDRTLLKAMDRALRRAGASPSESTSKLARGLGDARPAERPAPPEGTAAAAVGAYLLQQRDALVTMDPRVRRDEPDAVHKMRVATRRARSTLKTFRSLWDREEGSRLRDELKWLAEALGGVRDAEVLAARLTAALAEEPPELVIGPVAARLGDRLRAATAKHRRALIGVLDGRRYAALLDDLDALLTAPVSGTAAGSAEKVLRKQVGKAVEEVDGLIVDAMRAESRSTGTDLPLPGVPHPDEALHEARKAAKRARYAAEAATPVVGKPAASLATAFEEVQELLGGHQDAVVTRALLADAARAAYRAGENTFTYGRLHAKQELGTSSVAADLTAARETYRSKKIRAWLG